MAAGVRPLPGGMTPFGARTPGGRMTPAVHKMVPPTGKTPNPYHPPSITTPLQQQYPPAVSTAPALTGYGVPPPMTPQWGGMPPPPPPSQQPPPAALAHMNPARAALLGQAASGWGAQSGGGGNWPRR
jgi:hypothetical protein